MMKRETLAIADIYVPVKRRATLDQKRVNEIAASILEKGQQTPILVRADGARFVLVEGLKPGGTNPTKIRPFDPGLRLKG